MDAAAHLPPALIAPGLAAVPGVRHGFFGRQGGVSQGLYASLNTGPGSHDTPGAVQENRARVAAALGAQSDRLVSAYQVHSNRAALIDDPAVFAQSGAGREVDALVTRTPGLAVSALSADCAPILMADGAAGVVGAVHAGWRGALDGVLEAGLDAMRHAGAAREAIVAAVGPCIGQAAYEVGPEFVARFVDADGSNISYFRPGAGDRAHFDLKAYVAERLRRAGVLRVDVMTPCTCTDEASYFSNRRRTLRGESDYGRNIAAIMLAPA